MLADRRTPMLAAVLLLSGCGAASSSTTPAPAPAATVAPQAPASAGSGAASQEPSADPAVVTTPSGASYDDLIGTWVGEVVETVGEQYVWDATLTLEDCAQGETCGDFDLVTEDATSGEQVRCHYTIADPTYQEDFGTIALTESLVAADSGEYCTQTVTLAVWLMPSGATLAVEERADRQWISHALLRR